jgi:hypothetical protein
MTNDIKEITPVLVAPVIESPHLIKVKTISNKIVEQLQMIQELPQELWAQIEIIGIIPPYQHVLARVKDTGHIIKMNGLCFILAQEAVLEAQGLADANHVANQMLAGLPQVFQI